MPLGTAGTTSMSVDYQGDGFVVIHEWSSSFERLVAYDLDNPSQSVQLDGTAVAAVSGSKLAITTADPSTNFPQSLRVVQLSFGGTSVPTLIGVVGGKSAVSASAPLTLDLDLSKPVAAGTLTIKDPSGAVVGTVATPASSDGSLRKIAWTPSATATAGKYTWTLTAKDDLGKTVVANVGQGPATGSFQVSAAAASCGFVDVSSSNQYGSYICWMKTTGVTTGTSPTTYAPAANVTRGQMAAFMYRLAGSPTFTAPSKPTFTDVPASNEFFKQVEWLKHTGITTGTTPTTFAPTANVTRGQMAAFMYRLAGSPAFTAPTKATFSDVPASNEFFKQIEWLKNTGITTGTTPTTYTPVANVTREQMAAFMYRLAQKGYYCTDYPGGANC